MWYYRISVVLFHFYFCLLCIHYFCLKSIGTLKTAFKNLLRPCLWQLNTKPRYSHGCCWRADVWGAWQPLEFSTVLSQHLPMLLTFTQEQTCVLKGHKGGGLTHSWTSVLLGCVHVIPFTCRSFLSGNVTYCLLLCTKTKRKEIFFLIRISRPIQ